jgi:hypothetical protein
MWWPSRGRAALPEPEVRPEPKLDDFWDRLALFINALAREGAPKLIESLAPSRKERVARGIERMAEGSSADRHAWLARVFGPPPDMSARIQGALAGASGSLRTQMIRQLPSGQQIRPEAEVPSNGPPAPLTSALAERWIREALG